jgi:hypothetical protein
MSLYNMLYGINSYTKLAQRVAGLEDKNLGRASERGIVILLWRRVSW